MVHRRLSIPETFGLAPYGQTLRQAKLVFLGDPEVPSSRFDTTSLGIMTPRLSIGTWRGKRMGGRLIPLLNLFNHQQTPIEDGWSVRITQVQDFRGRSLTYDSHNGTDFVIPPGTVVTAAEAGRVVSIRQEFNRGGLKFYLDHGRGLITTYNHLGRSLVGLGDIVGAGEAIALSGYSGADGFLTFPWVAPHVHWNAIVAGRLVDPFAREGETSLWAKDNTPRPLPTAGSPEAYEASAFEEDAVDALLGAIKSPAHREALENRCPRWQLPFEALIESTVYPTRFAVPNAGTLLYPEGPRRESRLHLPFRAQDFDGVAFADDLGFR